jgi:hypothetical protein
VGDAAERHFRTASRRFAQQGTEGHSLGDPHVPPTLLHGFDNLVSHLLAGNVNREMRPVKAPEGRCGRFVVVGVGEHLGRDRPKLHEGGADWQPAQVCPQPPAVKWVSAAFDAE